MQLLDPALLHMIDNANKWTPQYFDRQHETNVIRERIQGGRTGDTQDFELYRNDKGRVAYWNGERERFPLHVNSNANMYDADEGKFSLVHL